MSTFEFIVEGILLGTCAVSGIFGNIGAIFIFYRKNRKQPFYSLMMFLSFFDLLYLIASLLLFSVPLIWNSAPSHPAFTKSIPFILPTAHIGMTGSIYLTISLAVERYITVCHPFFKLSHNWPAWVYVLPIVVFSSVFNLPKFFELETVERPSYNSTNETLHENNSLPLYMVQPTDLRLNELYISGYIVWANFIINCVFPFLVLIFLNLAVYNELKKIQVEEVGTSRAGQILRQKERKLAQVSFIIVFVFILCHSVRWVPNIWEMCEKDGLEWPVWIEYTTYISHLLTTFNGTVNVLIYFIKHGNFTCRRHTRTISRYNQTVECPMMTPSPLTPLDGTEHTRFAAFQLNNLRRNTEYATNSMHVPRSSVLRTQSDSKTVYSSRFSPNCSSNGLLQPCDLRSSFSSPISPSRHMLLNSSIAPSTSSFPTSSLTQSTSSLSPSTKSLAHTPLKPTTSRLKTFSPRRKQLRLNLTCSSSCHSRGNIEIQRQLELGMSETIYAETKFL